MASGIPSRRVHSSVSTAGLAENSGSLARARSRNNSSASEPAMPSDCPATRDNGGSGTVRSPGMASLSRLVARTVRSVQSASSFSMKAAATSSRCSQLSSTSSDRPRARYSCKAASSDRPGPSVTPSSAATASVTNPSRTGTRSVNTVPSGYLDAATSATLAARRVFPTPPGPSKVTRRLSSSAASTPPCSADRPMKVVRAAGRPTTIPVPACCRAVTTGARSASARRSGTPNFRSSADT